MNVDLVLDEGSVQKVGKVAAFGKGMNITENVRDSREGILMNKRMVFYCSAAIRGDTSYEQYFDKMVKIASLYGEVKTEKHGYAPLTRWTEAMKKQVYERDMKWIRKSNAILAECSGPSYGTGAEVNYGTRIVRIPALGLYNASSLPSLMLTQDKSKYTFPQKYSNEKDLENYVRLFLEILTRFKHIDAIRKHYLESREKVDPSFDKHKIRDLVESLSQENSGLVGVQGELELDVNLVTVARPKHIEIDFKDSEDLVEFMFRNLVLQKRWNDLKSQRIGSTFASGRKSRILNSLSQLDEPLELLRIYKRYGQDRLRYTQEAFTKNVRAYRRIGLFVRPKKPEKLRIGTTKFKDQIEILGTLYGDFKIRSSGSPREIMSNFIIVTQHLQHIAEFFRKFGSVSLVRLLKDAKRKGLYSTIPEIPTLNIDEVSIASFLDHKWAKHLFKYLESKCDEFYKEKYSSFA